MTPFQSAPAFIFWELEKDHPTNHIWVVRCYACCMPSRSNTRLVPMYAQDFKGHRQTCYECGKLIIEKQYSDAERFAAAAREDEEKCEKFWCKKRELFNHITEKEFQERRLAQELEQKLEQIKWSSSNKKKV